MNDKLRSLVKKIFITATAAISSTSVTASTNKTEATSSRDNTSQKLLNQTNFDKESKYPQLVLEKPSKFNLGSYLFPQHVSHASHASHASHVSGYAQPQTPKPRVKNKQEQSTEQQGQELTNQKKDTQILYKLGSRILKKDMGGTDVAELQDLLIKKGYKIKITAKFDKETESAVKQFQKEKKVEVTGEVDALTLYYLEKK